MGIQITPSILNADFGNLAAEVGRIPSADMVHVDVMDNHFVPNLTLGPTMVEALSRATDQPLDIHLMIDDPDRWAPAYVEAGGASVTFHVEAAAAPVRLARELRSQGARAGMALKPATPVDPYEDLLRELDMLLLMTVEPGFGGQKFLDLCLPKITRARELADKHGLDVWLQVDGGVSPETIERAPRPAPTCSSRARPCTPPTTPTPWSRSSAPSRPGPRPPERPPGSAVAGVTSRAAPVRGILGDDELTLACNWGR